MDTIKHVDISLWREWVPAIRKHARTLGIKHFRVFGEMFDGLPANLSQYTRDGKFPSVLDFGLYYAVKDMLADYQGTDRLAWVLSQDDMYNRKNASSQDLMTFVSNHDVGRIGDFINQMDISEQEKLARAKLAHDFIFLSRGYAGALLW